MKPVQSSRSVRWAVLLVACVVSHVRADVVVPDDQIVQGSQCVGLDCVNNESFGFDTLRLKENNTRIAFDDTSSSAGFPANDWQLMANDSASGGRDVFSLIDVTNSSTEIFAVEAAAASASLYVDSTSRVGFRTNAPALDLHVKTSNTPALRLDQDASGGFTAQTWDIGANEANFFVRDVTGGSKLPFRIRPGAPTSSIDINAAGDVGVGTASPTSALHIYRTTGAAAGMMRMSNTGGTFIEMENRSTTNIWSITHSNSAAGNFIIDSTVNGVGDGPEFTMAQNGNVTIQGTCTATSHINSSSRSVKEAFVAVDAERILEGVNRLEIQKWRYISDAGGTAHIGPMAEDFHEAFGVGADERHIDTVDTAGVALAAIQALSRENSELKVRIEKLEKRLEAR